MKNLNCILLTREEMAGASGDVNRAVSHAHVVICDGEVIKNRFGKITRPLKSLLSANVERMEG